MKNGNYYYILLIALCFLDFSAKGQVYWASELIKASSSLENKKYHGREILGPPMAMPQGGSSPRAWSPASPHGIEGIDVQFEPVKSPSLLFIAENYNPGAIIAVALFSPQGKKWEKKFSKEEMAPAPPQTSRMLSIELKGLDFTVNKVRIVLNSGWVEGWPQIDAVGLSQGQYPEFSFLTENFSRYQKKPLEHVNSQYDEVNPVISADGKTLFFTRKNFQGTGGGDDIWVSSNLRSPAKMGSPLNNSSHNSILALLPGENLVLLRNSYDLTATPPLPIALAQKSGNIYGRPVPLSIPDYNNSNPQSSFTLSSDGNILLMSMERYDGYGGLDIYVSQKTGDGWSPPVNLGPGINTAADEITPFLAADLQTLYFSSNGYPGFGNQDIYFTRKSGPGWDSWNTPVNLGPGVNSPQWDAYFTIPASGREAYFASYAREKNMSDIFQVPLDEELMPGPVILVKGRFVSPGNAPLHLPKNVNFTANPITGEFSFISLKDEVKLPDIDNDKYFVSGKLIDARGLKEYREEAMEIYFYSLDTGTVIPLRNIFFEFNKATLKEISFYELDRLYNLMKKYPDMEIEIAGHTDSAGSREYNLKLSSERAISVEKYLVSEGIDSKRIITKGYGEEKPFDPGDDELNRRVEFIIRKK